MAVDANALSGRIERRRVRRVLKYVALGATAILIIVTALLVSLPLLLDSESVKATAVRQLSQATGGRWHLSHLKLAWLPAPTISVADASFSIPGTIEGKVESLTLTTALLPLLWGDIRLSSVALVAPNLTVTVAPTPASSGAPFTVSDLRATLAGMSRLKVVDLSSLALAITRGRLVLAVPDQAGLTLSEINGHATQRSGRLEVDVTGASDVSRRVDAKVSLAPERFEGSVQLEAADIDLAALLAVAGAQGDPRLQGLVSARVKIRADGSPAVRGTFDARSKTLIVSGAGKLDLQGLVTTGEVEWTDAGLRVAARDTRLEAPALRGAAVLAFSPDWGRQHLEVKLQPAGLDTVKQVVLPWTTGTPEIERYARMITAGQLGALEATLQLDQIGHWQQAIEARGTVAGVALTLTRPELSIRDLGANLVLTQGKLTAERVQATTGKSTVQNGHMTVDFTTAQPRLSATARWQTDLEEALAFTKRQLAPRERERVGVLRGLSGDARGFVSLNGTFDALRVLAEAETIRAQASLEPLPWPINVTGAKARFDGSGLIVQGLTGTVGSSEFSSCSGQVTLAGPPRLHVSRCDADLALAELFEWGSRQWNMPDALKGLRVLGGRSLVQVQKIAGALAEPARWSVNVSAAPQAVRLSHPEAPGEVRLDGGTVRSDLTSLAIQGVKTEVLDAALRMSGTVAGLRDGTPHLDMQAAGKVGEKIQAWGWERGGLTRGAGVMAPLEARAVRLRWPVKKGYETAGELAFAGKTTLSLDALFAPGLVEIRKLAIQDEQSNVRIAARQHQDVLEGSFAGTLAGSSLDRIVQAKQLPETRVMGNLTFRVPLKQPRDFRANGELRINRLTSQAWPAAPLHAVVRAATIKAADRSVHLVTSFTAEDTNVDVSGTIRGTDQRYALDIDVKSDNVDVQRLLAAHGQQGGQRSEAPPTAWDLPVEGKVRLAVQSLRYGPHDVRPLRADLDIAPEYIDVAVREARLCGIDMTGGGRAQPTTLSFDVVLRARDIDTQPTLLCLSHERIAVTGRLHADAHLTGAGPYRELRFQGPFHLIAREGRVDRLTALAQILDLVNASEVLRGRKLSLSSSGFAYDRFELKGRVDGGAVQLDETVLEAQPFDLVAHGALDWLSDSIDMKVAIAPLHIVNRAVKRMPFLGYVLGGGVYAVPVLVRGKLSDPQVVPVAPAAVAGELLGVLGRTLKAPFNLREALLPPALQADDAAPPPPSAPLPNPGPRP